MKKQLLMGLFMVFGVLTFAQKNVVKLGLGSAVTSRDVNLKYERVFGERHALNVTLLLDTPESFDTGTINPENTANDNGTLSGYAIVPEYRYYFGSKGGPRGFYAGVYARYRARNFNITSTFDTDIEVDSKVTLNNFGGGIGCGVQWIIADHFAIDWYIFGIGYNSFGLRATVTPTNPDQFERLRTDLLADIDSYERPVDEQTGQILDQIEFEKLLAEFRETVETTEVKEIKTPRIPFGLLDLRTGISIGYAF